MAAEHLSQDSIRSTPLSRMAELAGEHPVEVEVRDGEGGRFGLGVTKTMPFGAFAEAIQAGDRTLYLTTQTPAALDDGRAALMAPQTTLQDLGELARLASVFISGDTGPLHLAAAVGTPCVGLFGPVPGSRNGPYGRGHACVEPPALLRPAWGDRKTDTLSMQGIEVADVLAATHTLLARSQAA
jgi:hypothetical protein